MNRILVILLVSSVISLQCGNPFRAVEDNIITANRWSEEKARSWYAEIPWLVGCNFIPSTAINQLEMWQSNTWDPATIDKELAMAARLGFNLIRVYLHDLAYQQDPDGFLKRIDTFLSIAEKHGIRVMLVIFDDCWLAYPESGKQPEPLPGVHNSGWLESPGMPALKKYPNDKLVRRRLETYVKAVLQRFKSDERVLIWDLYNEPGGIWYKRGEGGKKFENGAIGELCLPLLNDVYIWAREVSPEQPITSCFYGRKESVKAATKWADIITFHNYSDAQALAKMINDLKKYNRPIICSEYMARHTKSTFLGCLPVMKKEKVGAVNWGLVAGKSNTIYPWASWEKPGVTPEPRIWFHDILRKDGSAFDHKEVEFIRAIAGPEIEAQQENSTDKK